MIDVYGEPIVKDSLVIRYIKQSKHTEFVPWKDFLPGKYLYSYTGNLYKDTVSLNKAECDFYVCLVCVQITGDWMEIRPPKNHDCNQLMDEKCLRSYWIKWFDDNKMLVRFVPSMAISSPN